MSPCDALNLGGTLNLKKKGLVSFATHSARFSFQIEQIRTEGLSFNAS